MVQIQIKQKQEVVDVDDVDKVEDAQHVSPPASYAIWERVEGRKMSLVRALMCVGSALLMVMLVSRMVWALKMLQQDQVGLDGSIQMLEMVPSGFGHEIDLTVTCTYATGAAPWTKDCSCSGIFHCGCVLEVTQCMKGGGCANICFGKQEQSLEIV
eukprot:GFUD01071633.1.p1 GENE.GFUD01071633.1~~GFUD01071633.1.p1  ORF type:complete len:170 (+),score=60.86 GFUD01071633.1:45-512(+)